MNKPRRFYISPIYVDERKERLEAIERQARSELAASSSVSGGPSVPGGFPAGKTAADSLRGAFRSSQRSRRGGAWLWAPMVLAALALILIIGVMLSL